VAGWLGRARLYPPTTSFGYTASIWRRAAREVFGSIGQASLLRTSPPLTCEEMPPLGPIAPRFSYFNLHGLRDSAYWYGQRDPTYAASYPLFPVAIEPDNIPVVPHPEAIVFSEACYGAYILNKHQMSSLALRFLAAQALGVVGSTALAYGAIDAPLVGADLLARAFWERVKAGSPLGEALRLAKRALIQEMLARQGYLDPEDEKTILSFVLYGDPTLVVEAGAGDEGLGMPSSATGEREAFSLQRRVNPQVISMLHIPSSANGDERTASTLCRRPVSKAGVVSPELMTRVRHRLASYLPSSVWTDVTVSAQTLCSENRCHQQCSLCRALASDQSATPVPQAQTAKTGREYLPAHAELVFTLQQKSSAPEEIADKVAVHHQIVKVTVDSRGHLVKVAISR